MQFMQKSAIALGVACANIFPETGTMQAPASSAITKIMSGVQPATEAKLGAWSKTLLLTMKLTVILLTVFLVQVHASGYSQSVTLSVKDAPLREVFAEVKKQTGFFVFYNRDLLSDATPVSFSVYNAPLKDFMAICLKGQPLDFLIKDKTIILMQRVADAYPVKDTTISGRVTDEKGKPVPSVTVRTTWNNTMHIGITDEDGNFSIQYPDPGALIQVSGVSIMPWEGRPKNGETMMNIVVKSKVYQLTDVNVVLNTGYQVLSKERATGSFGKPDMQTFSKRTGTMDVVARLEGLVPGLAVTFSKSAYTSGKQQQTFIRGISTVNNGNSEPLYVVNGVILPNIETLNPDDIEDITVLKDAAASAIYGARSANGVIVIMTKSGTKNQRLRVSYSGFMNYQGKPDFDYIPMMNSQQYIQTARELFNPDLNPWGNMYDRFMAPHDLILYNQYRGIITAAEANKSLDSLAGINNMSQIKDIFYNQAFTTNHTVSVSGGNNVYSFYGSFNYTGSQPLTPGAKDNSYRLNLSQNLNIGSRVKLSLNTTLLNQVSSSKGSENVTNSFLPYQLFKDANGNSIAMPYMMGWGDSLRLDYQARSRISMDFDPLKELDYMHNTSNLISANVTGNITIDLWKGLSFSGVYGYQRSPGNTTSFVDNRQRYQRMQLLSLTVAPTVNDEPIYYLPVKGGYYKTNTSNDRNWTVRNQLVYETQPRHGLDHLTIQAGQEALEQMTSSEGNVFYGYDQTLGTSALIDYLTLSRGIPNTITGWGSLYQDENRGRSVSRFSSYFALGSYTYNDKYNIDISWRQDRSSLFGSDVSSQNKPVWSLGGKWQVSKERFMEPVTWVNNLGVRLTFGLTGNSPYVGAASSNDVLYAYPQSSSQGVAGDALVLSQPANRMLAWETTRNLNFGIDFAVLNSRISGSLDLYHRVTSDMLGNVRLNSLSGFTNATGNIGQLNNNGVELSLQTLNVNGKNFSWNTRLVFAYNHNKLVSYAPLPDYYQNDPSYKLFASHLVGYSMMSLFAYRYAGLDNMGDPQIRLADGTISKDPYIAKGDDVHHMGTRQPVFNGGFTNTFRYKGISLALNMVYNFGHVMRADAFSFYTDRLAGYNGFSGLNVSPEFLNRWKKPGDEAFTNIPSYVADPNIAWSRRQTDYYRHGDINVVSASFVKLRDVTLSYELPEPSLQWLNLQQLNIFVQSTNYLLWKANKRGLDPEFEDFENGARVLPTSRHNYSVGLNITL